MGVFDQIGIQVGALDMATIQRSDAPLEDGFFRSGAWVPAAGDQRISVPGLGVDVNGPYFDPVNENPPSEGAVLVLNAITSQVWVDGNV